MAVIFQVGDETAGVPGDEGGVVGLDVDGVFELFGPRSAVSATAIPYNLIACEYPCGELTGYRKGNIPSASTTPSPSTSHDHPANGHKWQPNTRA